MTVHDSWTVDRLVDAYTHHQRRTRGLRPQTLRNRAWFARTLVRAALGTDPIDPSRLTPAAVVAFITSLRHRFCPASMRTARSSLRSFFRFLRVEGFCGDALEAALPTVAHWRLATLPRSLTEQQVEQVLASFDASIPCGQRDQAIVQCLAALGAAARRGGRPVSGRHRLARRHPADTRPKEPSRRRAAAAPRGGAGAGRLSEQGASGDRRTSGVRRAPGRSSRQAALEPCRLACRGTRGSPGGSRRAARRRQRLPAHRSQPHGARGSQPQRGR